MGKRNCVPSWSRVYPLHCDCWWFLHYDICPVPRLRSALADCSRALPPPLLLQQLDAVVDVELDRPPVSLVAHQQRAEFEASFAVRLRGDAQFHEVSLQVSLHCYTLGFWPGTLQDTALPCVTEAEEWHSLMTEVLIQMFVRSRTNNDRFYLI